MSTPDGTGSSRRRRNSGLALLGLAVLAVLIGVVALTCQQQSVKSRPSLTTPPSVPGSGSATPSVLPYPPPATSRPAEAPEVVPAPGPPEPATAPPASDQGPGKGEKGGSRPEVRVYNNSTIRGLAARAARDLTAEGWTVADVGNYPCGTIPTTTVYYQKGTGQRTEAEEIGADFGMRVLPRFPGIVNASPGLIVIVTKDYRR